MPQDQPDPIGPGDIHEDPNLHPVLRTVVDDETTSSDQVPQRLRFRATHLPAVRDGSKRITMRFKDPVQVGPALLVFEFDDEVSLRGRIISTVAKPVGGITDAEAREDGFGSATDVLPGLRDYYPELQPDDELVIVRFEVDD